MFLHQCSAKEAVATELCKPVSEIFVLILNNSIVQKYQEASLICINIIIGS